ncbi:transcriptional regulator [Streptomyces hainanensis]|uniref:Transcriptional regulator n=2 Tax=Streptomyces hainanensis TaxID=402648 RepID=A0A4R4T750_9ACTN|nr:transcriptional regulator [Streptomyces hainanensis]
MQRACAERNFSEIFRLVNRRTGSSYADMAAAVGKMTSSRIGDVIRGVRGIRGHTVIERIADGFGIPGEMLGLPERPWERGTPATVDVSTGSGPSVARVQDEEFSVRADHEHTNITSIDLMMVATLRQQVQALDDRYSTEPSMALIAEVGRHLGQVVHWQSYATTYSVRRDLCAAMAETSTLMGQLVWDASGRTDHKTARTYFDQAVWAAKELRDPVAEGLALLRTSYVALYGEKDPENGLQLTRQVTETVKGASPALSGLAVLHSAEAHAMLQQRRECEKALRDAERHLEQVDSVDAGAFGRLAGSCYLSLADTARAQAVLEGTIREVHEGSKSQAITLGNLSLALIRQRKVDEAVGTLGRAIDIVEGHRGGGGLNLIFQAGRELQSWHEVSGVRDLNDRLFGLIASV